MSLARALVDQARRVYNREDPSGPWREGGPKAEQAFGPWVRVRFRQQAQTEQGDMVRVDESGGLLIGLVDVDGNPTYVNGRFTAWDADDLVEIVSAEGQHEFWEVASGVRPLRARNRYVGFRCDIRVSREAEVTEEPLAVPDVDPVLLGPAAAAPVPTPAGLPVVDDWDVEGG